MNTLPAEILLAIGDILPLRDRLHLGLTCKEYHNWLVQDKTYLVKVLTAADIKTVNAKFFKDFFEFLQPKHFTVTNLIFFTDFFNYFIPEQLVKFNFSLIKREDLIHSIDKISSPITFSIKKMTAIVKFLHSFQIHQPKIEDESPINKDDKDSFINYDHHCIHPPAFSLAQEEKNFSLLSLEKKESTIAKYLRDIQQEQSSLENELDSRITRAPILFLQGSVFLTDTLSMDLLDPSLVKQTFFNLCKERKFKSLSLRAPTRYHYATFHRGLFKGFCDALKEQALKEEESAKSFDCFEGFTLRESDMPLWIETFKDRKIKILRVQLHDIFSADLVNQFFSIVLKLDPTASVKIELGYRWLNLFQEFESKMHEINSSWELELIE